MPSAAVSSGVTLRGSERWGEPQAFLLSPIHLLFCPNTQPTRPGLGVRTARGQQPGELFSALGRSSHAGSHGPILREPNGRVEKLTWSVHFQQTLKSSPRGPWAWSDLPQPPGLSLPLPASRRSLEKTGWPSLAHLPSTSSPAPRPARPT